MKRAALFVLLFLGTVGAFAQNPGWLWAASGGGGDEDLVSDLATQSAFPGGANKYIIGSFSGTAYFGSTILTSAGGTDIYIAKLDQNNNWVWAVRAGGANNDHGVGISNDGLGYMCFTGDFTGTATFGTTTLTSTNSSYPDIFVAKLDSNGAWQWAVKAGANYEDYGMGISNDNAGNAYVTGSYYASTGGAYFGSIYLSHSDLSDDIFVAKIDPNGNWLWAAKAGANWDTWNSDRAYGIHTDYSTGTSFVTGSFEGGIYFWPWSATSAGGQDLFIAEIDTNGNWLWVQRAGGSGFDRGYHIDADLTGISYVVGSFTGTATFAYNQILTSSGSNDICVAKLSADGSSWQWAVRAGGSGQDQGFGIDLGDKVYITGSFRNTAGFGSTSLTSGGSDDIYAAALDTNGNWQWAVRAGREGSDFGRGITAGYSSFGGWRVTVAGDFENTVRFSGTLLSSTGQSDAFIAQPTSNYGPLIPLAPQNLTAAYSPPFLLVQWDPVNHDTNGNNLTVDYYRIYSATNPQGPFAPTGVTTIYNWWMAVFPPEQRLFYLVKAVVLD